LPRWDDDERLLPVAAGVDDEWRRMSRDRELDRGHAEPATRDDNVITMATTRTVAEAQRILQEMFAK
jgi:hypothetical protein